MSVLNERKFIRTYFLIIIFFTALLSMIIEVIGCLGGIKACTKLHNNLLSRVLRWPLCSFDTTPTGRILSRFESDMSIIDNWIIRMIMFALNQSLTVCLNLFRAFALFLWRIVSHFETRLLPVSSFVFRKALLQVIVSWSVKGKMKVMEKLYGNGVYISVIW